jgi:hypothetical protein
MTTQAEIEAAARDLIKRVTESKGKPRDRASIDCDIRDNPRIALLAIESLANLLQASEALKRGYIDATLEAAARASWQPIETAPKDGTVIDVWLGNASKSDVLFYCTPGTRRSCGWHWSNGKFRPTMGLQTPAVFIVPTHWQSLPSPPPEST